MNPSPILEPEEDKVRRWWTRQMERGWHQAQAGRAVPGDEAFRKARERLAQRNRMKSVATSRPAPSGIAPTAPDRGLSCARLFR